MSDLSQQVRLQNELNEAIKQRNSLIEQQNKLLSRQSELSSAIGKSAASPKTTRRVRDMTGAIRQNNSALDESVDSSKELEDALNEAADAAEESSESFSLLGAAASGLKGAFTGAVGIFKAVGSALLSIGASVAKAAFSILMFPFKMFGMLVDLAQQGGGGRPLAEAYEEVREVFGDLASGPGKTLISTFKQVRKEGRNLAGSGVSIRNIFGYGREGRAAMLKDLNEIAGAMGDNFHRLEKQFANMGSKNIIFQRGLGVSKEEYGELAGIVESRGGDIEKYMTDFAKTAQQSAKAFGMGVKDMAKGMKELVLDVETFGHLGPKAFAPMAAYARKLGLEIKTMSGIMNKFSGFQDTTEAASKMAQQFGMNVDSMALMQAQNPAEKIDILRKSFFKAGNNLKDFNFQQRQYLSSLTDLKGKELDAAFAAEKQGINYSNIAKNAKKAQKSQKTQKQVLQDLGKGIKRLIQTMSGPKVKGFFDAFIKGFERGILRSQDMRELFKNIRSGLRRMRHLGIRVGKAFVKYFPGVKDMLKAISDFLDPVRFEIFQRKALPIFEKLFKTQNFTEFFDEMSGLFSENFGDGGGALGKLGKAFSTFTNGLTKIAGQALAKIVEIFIKGLTAIGQLILDPSGLSAGMSATGDKLMNDGSNLLTPTIEMLQDEGGPMKQFQEVGKKIVESIKDGLGLGVEEGEDPDFMIRMMDRAIAALKEGGEGFTKMAEKMGELAILILEKAADFAMENPAMAAAILLIFNPFGVRSIVLSLTGALVKGFAGILTKVFTSKGVLFAMTQGAGWIAGKLGPMLGSAFSGMGGMITAGLSKMGGAGGVNMGRFGKFGGAASSGAARLGVYGLVAKIGYDTFNRASEILDDPQLKKAGITTGEAIGAGYIEALGLDGLANFIAGNSESAAEILARVKKEGEQFEERLSESMTASAENFTKINARRMSRKMKAIAAAGRSGDKERQKVLMDQLLEQQIQQQYTELTNSPEFKEKLKEATGAGATAMLKKMQRKARAAATAGFDAEGIAKQAEAALVEEESDEIKLAREKLQRLKAQAEISAAVEALGDVEAKMKSANEKISNIDTPALQVMFTNILTKIGGVYSAISESLKSPKFAELIGTNESLDVLKPVQNAASFLKIATTSFTGVVENILAIDKLLKSSMGKLRKLNVKTFESNMTGAAEKLAKIPAAIIAGLSPLMKSKGKTKGLLASVLPPRVMATFAKFGFGVGGAAATSFTKSNSQEVITALKNINAFIGPVASKLNLTISSFKKFQAAIKSIPSVSKKYIDAASKKVKGLIGGVGALLNAVYNGLSIFHRPDSGPASMKTPVEVAINLQGMGEDVITALNVHTKTIGPAGTQINAFVTAFNTFKKSLGGSLSKGLKGMKNVKDNMKNLVSGITEIIGAAKMLSDPELHMKYIGEETAALYAESATSGLRAIGAFINAAFSKGDGSGKTMKKLADKSTPQKLMSANKSIINSGLVLKSLAKTLDSAKKLTAPSLIVSKTLAWQSTTP